MTTNVTCPDCHKPIQCEDINASVGSVVCPECKTLVDLADHGDSVVAKIPMCWKCKDAVREPGKEPHSFTITGCVAEARVQGCDATARMYCPLLRRNRVGPPFDD